MTAGPTRRQRPARARPAPLADLSGRTVLITGAARGMGRLYADLAVRSAADALILWDLDGNLLDKARRELEGHGTRIFVDTVDIAGFPAIEAAAARVRAAVGTPDVLVNNVGIVRGKYFWEHDQRTDIARTMAVNVLAPLHITREFLPDMIAAGRPGRILNIASAAGLLANPRMSVYAASKWAAVGWSESLRLELEQAGHRHLAVTTVCPSYIGTGMFEGVRTPLFTPLLGPEEAAARIWAAMLAGRPLLLLPRRAHLIRVLRGMLPLRAWDFLADRVLGVYRSMETFHGRG